MSFRRLLAALAAAGILAAGAGAAPASAAVTGYQPGGSSSLPAVQKGDLTGVSAVQLNFARGY